MYNALIFLLGGVSNLGLKLSCFNDSLNIHVGVSFIVMPYIDQKDICIVVLGQVEVVQMILVLDEFEDATQVVYFEGGLIAIMCQMVLRAY